MQESGLIEIILLICTSVVWGWYPCFLILSLRASEGIIWGGCSSWLVGGGHPVSLLSLLWAHHWVAVMCWIDGWTSFVYWYGRQHFFILIIGFPPPVLGLEFSTGNDSEFLLRLVDGHKKVEILPLSTVIRHLEIQVSEKRHRNTGQRLVFWGARSVKI